MARRGRAVEAHSAVLTLRTATASQHSDLESLLDLLSPGLDLKRLEVVVRCFAAFYEELEARVDATISPELAEQLDWGSRKKHPILLCDLNLFGPGPVPPIFIPSIENDAEVLGALYVVEGATLGGQMIGPHIGQLFPGHPVRIFSVYGDRAPQAWKVFRSVLNEHLALVEDQEQAKAAAIATFECLSQTFERELAL